MKIRSSLSTTIGVATYLCFGASSALPFGEGGSFDPATVLPDAPAVWVETDAYNVGVPCIPKKAPTYTPQVHTPNSIIGTSKTGPTKGVPGGGHSQMPPCNHGVQPPPSHSSTLPSKSNTVTFDPRNAALQRGREATIQAQQLVLMEHQLQVNGFVAYAATSLQRSVAESHARAFMAAYRQAQMEDTASIDSGRSVRRLTSLATKQTSDTHKSDQKHQPKKRHRRHVRRKPPRYIAVDSVRDKSSTHHAKKTVMIWDTQSEALVGNYAYDVKDSPALGKSMVFQNYSAEYVGAGTQIPDNLFEPTTSTQ